VNQSDSFSINVNVTLFDRTSAESQKVYNLTIETISSNTENITAAAPSGFVGNVNPNPAEVIKPPQPINLATEAPTQASSTTRTSSTTKASATKFTIPPFNSIALKNGNSFSYLSLSINLLFTLFVV
jgi:hypothetical protein